MNRPLKILIVEDSPYVQKALVAMLSLDSNLTTEVAGSIREATEMIHTGHFNVILLDLLLPDANDLEGLTALQKDFPVMPIVVLSGLGKDMEASVMESGAQDFLEKPPASSAALIEALRKAAIRNAASLRFAEIHASRQATAQAIEEFETVRAR